MLERVQKLMARANVASRRACEELIVAGRVRINGQTATLGDKADPSKDIVTVDGVTLDLKQFHKTYIAYYKPINVLSTTEPHRGDDRPTVREMIPVEGHLFTIGRLDAESEGLIILTNDGDTANRLAHPRYQHTKTYKVTVHGTPSRQVLEQWQDGVWVDGELTAPCYIRVLHEAHDTTILRIVMTEGRKRQIRRVASQLGNPVHRLLRTHVGQLELGPMRKGEWRVLEEDEIESMKTPAEELKFIRKRRVQSGRRVARPPEPDRASTEKPAEQRPGEKAPSVWKGRARPGTGPSASRPASSGGRGKRPVKPTGGAVRGETKRPPKSGPKGGPKGRTKKP